MGNRPGGVAPVQDALIYDDNSAQGQAAELLAEACGTLRPEAAKPQALTSMPAAYSLGECREAAVEDDGHGADQGSGLGVGGTCVGLQIRGPPRATRCDCNRMTQCMRTST